MAEYRGKRDQHLHTDPSEKWQMRLSVVIPVYNVEKYIRECVDSVLNQTMKDFELVMVDDGSTDSSGFILDAYQEKDHRIRVIHKKNGGVSAARNDALKCCTGDYVYIMDSDDYLEPDAFSTMCEEAVRTNADVVITDHCKFAKQEVQNPVHFFGESFVTEDPDIIAQLQNMVLHKSYAPFQTSENNGMGLGAPWTKLVKAELIREHRLQFDPYVRGVFDDCLFSLGVFEYARSVSYVRKITYHFRVLQSSLTHRFRPDQLDIYSRIFERIQDFYISFQKGNQFLEAYYARVITYLSMSFDTYFFHKAYQGGKRKNLHEYMTTVKSDVYQKAIHGVDRSRLSKREKRIVDFDRKHLSWLLWLAYTVRHMIRK